MTMKQTLTLSLFSFLALILAINGAHVAAPPPSVDCTSVIMTMADCLTFVERGSTIAKPEKTCCAGLQTVLKENPFCLCEVFTESASLGITIDDKKALTLPDACHVKAPPFSKCNITLPGVTSPASSPPAASSPRTSSPPPAASSPVILPGVTPPTSSPPAASPPHASSAPAASSPITLPAITPAASSPAVAPTTNGNDSSSAPASEPLISTDYSPDSSADSSPPEKSMATQIKTHMFTIVTIFAAFMMIYRISI